MIKLKKKNQRELEAEEKKKEDEANGIVSDEPAKKKKNPGELRLQGELAELDLPAHAKCVWAPGESIMNFKMHLDLKNEQCIWKGGQYEFEIQVSNSYPHEAPKCYCKTPVYHPNIDLQGNVCLNILRADWKPVLGINAVILGLVFLFIEPNPDDPLNHEAAAVMRSSLANFGNIVKRTLRGGIYEGVNYPKFT